jgi:hypothetical protein
LIGLFLAFQISASAHGATYGDSPHEHDGISCVITALAEHDQGVLPVKPEIVATRISVDFVWDEPFVSILFPTNQTRAPPPRGPPSPFQ